MRCKADASGQPQNKRPGKVGWLDVTDVGIGEKRRISGHGKKNTLVRKKPTGGPAMNAVHPLKRKKIKNPRRKIQEEEDLPYKEKRGRDWGGKKWAASIMNQKKKKEQE